MNEKYLDLARQVVPDKRLLINAASKRAAELARNARPLVVVPPQDDRNFLDIALLEIAEGKLVVSFKPFEAPAV